MTWLETLQFLSGCLPRPVARTLAVQPEGSVREIRVRAGGRACVLTSEGESICPGVISQQQVAQMAEALCEHALYVRAEEQRQGFVTLRGGHRMGLCGRVVTHGQSIRALREISSLCIRVAGQWLGAADALEPRLETVGVVDGRGGGAATGGTGLGLAIVKHIAAKHGAVISMDSELGSGTTITVSFERMNGYERKEWHDHV